VPVRFRNGPVTKLGTITGVQPNARLTGLETKDGTPVMIPPEGVVFTLALADRLGVSAGDSIRVEVLEGTRPHRDLRVDRVIEEYVGTAAYMDRTALSRMLREAPSASGAHLSVDETQEPELFRTLKEIPLARSVTARRAALATFREMVDRTMGTMILTYVAFASVIAIGVVYNNARIALSERARELGSLRVLGFSHREVSYILLGELALLTLVALPLGWGLGWILAAQMVSMFDTNVFRLPLIIQPASYGYASLVVVGAATGAGWLVARRVAHLDLVQVLKTRE
jgi:putative ABC transport system permease protein